MKTKLLFLSALLAVAACKTEKKETQVVLLPSDQEQIDLASTITEQELKEHLYTYASDDFEGRETGTAGQKKAIEYLVSQYSSLGIPMASGTVNYLQKLPVTYTTAPSGSLRINDQSYTIGTDFITFSAATGSYEAVFVGYGIDSPEYSNYGDIEVQGKLVIAMAGEPQNEDGTYILTGTTTYSKWSNASEALP
ncbi:MAG: peptidase, partial [Flavobacteriaceae bacterium]